MDRDDLFEKMTEEYGEAICDECGVPNDDCECIACSECLEFGPGALTKDQDLALCEDCAVEKGVELISISQAIKHSENCFKEEFNARMDDRS